MLAGNSSKISLEVSDGPLGIFLILSMSLALTRKKGSLRQLEYTHLEAKNVHVIYKIDPAPVRRLENNSAATFYDD